MRWTADREVCRNAKHKVTKITVSVSKCDLRSKTEVLILQRFNMKTISYYIMLGNMKKDCCEKRVSNYHICMKQHINVD